MGEAILNSKQDIKDFSWGFRGNKPKSQGIIDQIKTLLMRKITNPERIAYIKRMTELGYTLRDRMWRKPGADGKEILITDGLTPKGYFQKKNTDKTLLTSGLME